jgi:hypothetical protein
LGGKIAAVQFNEEVVDNNLRKQIYGNMNLKETEDLVEIWQENDRKEWSDLAFDVIREILVNRLGELPIQTGQIGKKEIALTEPPAKYPKNKVLLVTEYSYLVLFALLLVSKGFLPDAGGGWSDPPIFDYLFLVGCGVCFLIISVIQSYFAWTLNAKEYHEWNYSQIIIGKKWAQKFGRLYPDWYVLWSNRIIGPFIALIVVAIFSFVVFETTSSH